MAIEDAGLLSALANWVGGVGVPALFLAWYRLWQKSHEHELQIAELKSQLSEQANLRAEVKEIRGNLSEIRSLVVEIKTRMEYTERRNGDERRTRHGD